jgi:lipopolysaccharide transport system permease protein
VSASSPHIRIEPKNGWVSIDLKELWAYRELLVFLAWRDVKVRYKQTLLGAAWAVLVPLLTMIVFNVLFGLLMGPNGKPAPDGVPYAISTFAALVPWQLFANAMSQSSNSIVANRNLITKIYFPRIIAPLAPVLAALVDFAIAFGVLLVLIAGYHVFTDYNFEPTWRLVLLPLFVVLAVVTALALSMWLSAMNAVYRDVRYIVPFLVQMLMFVSPVVYSMDSVIKPDTPAWAAILYGLNPLASVVQGFRWVLFGAPLPPPALMTASALSMGLLLVGGAFYFRRMERLFADLA